MNRQKNGGDPKRAVYLQAEHDSWTEAYETPLSTIGYWLRNVATEAQHCGPWCEEVGLEHYTTTLFDVECL